MQSVALQVQRLRTVRLRDAGVADQHVSQTAVWDMTVPVSPSKRLRVSYTMSDSMLRIRPTREHGSENQPTTVGPVFPSATRDGAATPLHAERRRPAAHRGAAATPQQAGLRAATMCAPLPGPSAGSGGVRSTSGRGLHRPPARPGRVRARRLTRCAPRPGTSTLPSCAGCTDSGLSRAARRVSSTTGSAKRRRWRGRTRTWRAGSSMPAGRHARSCRPRRRSNGCAPTRWSTPNAGSKPASPSGFRPTSGAHWSICSTKRSTPA